MLSYWKKYVSENGLIYSCDMIRLNLEFFNVGLENVSKYLCTSTRIDIEVYPINLCQFKYRNLVVIDYGESTMSVGLHFNGSRSSDTLKGFLEFNPNKCFCEQFEKDIAYIISQCFTSELVRWDLAIDIPIRRDFLYLPKDQRLYSMQKASNEDITEYLGRRNTVGRTKLYNKTLESNLDHDLTRYEVTLSGDFYDCGKYIGPVYRRNYDEVVLGKELKPNDQVLIELLQQCENPDYYFRRLSYHMRKKIELYVNCNDVIGFEPWYIDYLFNDICYMCVK